MNEKFPHANALLYPVQAFRIGERTLCLYSHVNRPARSSYSLYWQDEQNPVQHGATAHEVFGILARLLEGVREP